MKNIGSERRISNYPSWQHALKSKKGSIIDAFPSRNTNKTSVSLLETVSFLFYRIKKSNIKVMPL